MSLENVLSALLGALIPTYLFLFHREITERWPTNAAMRKSAFAWFSGNSMWMSVLGPIALAALAWRAPDRIDKGTVLLMCLVVSVMCFGVMLASVHSLTLRLGGVHDAVVVLAESHRILIGPSPPTDRTATKEAAGSNG